MKKLRAVQTSELFVINEARVELKRLLLPDELYKDYPTEALSVELNGFTQNSGTYLIAFKYVEVESPNIIKKEGFSIVLNTEFKDLSDWYVEPLFVQSDIQIIDRRVDPAILLRDNGKNLKYRLTYYLDLINQGYTNEQAMDTIFS